MQPVTGWQSAQPTAALRPSDAEASSLFGASVALSEDTVVVGAPVQSQVGAAYVFVEPSSGWQDMNQTAELGIDSQSSSNLGASVAVDGEVVLAGDPEITVGATVGQGIAAAYFKPAGGWVDTTAPDISISSLGRQTGDLLGSSVALTSTVVVIGAPGRKISGAPSGAAFVFGEQ